TKASIGKIDAFPITIGRKTITSCAIVSEARNYAVIIENDWMKKARARLDWEECELMIQKPKYDEESEDYTMDEESELKSSEDEEYKEKSLINKTYLYWKFEEIGNEPVTCEICLKKGHGGEECIFQKNLEIATFMWKKKRK
ncbi:10349_t:CDS:2, partial [Cetraspora pellucida]